MLEKLGLGTVQFGQAYGVSNTRGQVSTEEAAAILDRAAKAGIQSGDVEAGSAIVWARADRTSRMHVEYATVESFRSILGSASADALPDADFTAKLSLDGNLPAFTTILLLPPAHPTACGVPWCIVMPETHEFCSHQETP